MKETLQKLFSPENEMGVYYKIIDPDESDKHFTSSELDEYVARLGHGVGVTSHFPNGSSFCCCTDHAINVGKMCPGRVKIFGFENKDNPTAWIVRGSLHPGGHDFAILDDRYLIDTWIWHIAYETRQTVFDLQDKADTDTVLRLYGPRECWKRMTEAEKEI